MFLVQLLFSLCLAAKATSATATASLPTVDLGYEVHQAISFNSTGGYYNFSNIRYAQPPVGNLRFAAPVPPKGKSKNVQKGEIGSICPQAMGAWVLIAEDLATSIALGTPFNYSAAYSNYELVEKNLKLFAAAASSDPRTSEDCLFLDVMVPKKIFDNKGKGKGAAVLVWIYGGGYTTGSKGGSGNPAGLIHASQSSGSDGVIYVSMNYRLGAMGWSAGPTFQGDGGVPNAGLYDQRLALEWIQDNIHLFGGDPNRVTIIGESAGGGSIMHQITAYAGLKPVPFHQAIPQSPAWLPMVSASLQENIWNAFLKLCNVSSLAEARKLPSETIIMASSFQIASTQNYGGFTYGPAVDGYFVPELPGRMLLEGHFAKHLKIMTGYNTNEGTLFTNPGLTSSEYTNYLKINYPGISQAASNYIQNILYPPKLDGSYGYKSQLQRLILSISESIFTCNTNYLARAYGNKTYSYQFSVPPALHGEDVAFTYYNGNVTSVLGFPDIAIALQQLITSFAETGVPSAKGAPVFPTYGPNTQVMNINVTGLSVIKDPNANKRCYWWQKGLFN